MDVERRQWTWGGWALVTGCLILAIGYGLSATVARSHRMSPRPTPAQGAMTTVVPKACLSEFYAYLRVADTARDLGSDRNILDFALDRLHTSLVDCLADDAAPKPRSEAVLTDRTLREIVSPARASAA